jgi:hypothetical protein
VGEGLDMGFGEVWGQLIEELLGSLRIANEGGGVTEGEEDLEFGMALDKLRVSLERELT